jgi:hypothetical protein
VALYAAVAVFVVAMTTAQPGSDLSPADGSALEAKIATLVANDQRQRQDNTPVVLEEHEINAYLQFQAAPLLPVGVTQPHVQLDDGGQITIQSDVDLGVVSAATPRGPFDPMRYLRGVVPVVAMGTFDAQNGLGQLNVESVSVGGIPVPLSVLRELVASYSRTETLPDGFDVNRPFPLPYGLTSVTIDRGHAIVIQ